MARHPLAALLALLICLLLTAAMRAAQPGATPSRVHGFVVGIESPTALVIDDYRITEDRIYHVTLDAPAPEIHVGSEVQVDGGRVLSHAALSERVEGRVILSEGPRDGIIAADGHRLRLLPSTRVLFAQPGPASLDQVGPDVVLRYKASHREPDGTMAADEVELRSNQQEPGERELLKRLEMQLNEPDFERHKPGGLRVYRSLYYEIIANREAQQYMDELGWSLVPRYQREIAADAPTRIPFKFYVVKRDEAGAGALPNGVIVVYSRLFDAVENEAQLAAALGHEIAHVVQKHRWQLAGKIAGEFNNAYDRTFENQADQLSLRYMVDAGYDPREAPRVWKVLTKKFGFVLTNAFAGTHDNHALRREYLMHGLAENYRDLDYDALTTGADRFAHMARLVKREVDPGWGAKNDR
jgi:hypothetical protein